MSGNAPIGFQPFGPISLPCDAVFTIPKVGGALLVKRTATGVALCGDGEYPCGVIMENTDAIGDFVAVYGLANARFPFIVNDSGDLATIGTWLLPAANGCVKAGTVPTAGFHFVSDSAADDTEIVFAISGLC